MEKIFSDKLPMPAGHYSHGVLHNGFLFVSGQTGFDYSTNKVADTIAGEATTALSNMKLIIEAAGGKIENVTKVTIFISNMDYWEEVNAAYKAFFGDHKPARAIIPCGSFGDEEHLELEAIAAI